MHELGHYTFARLWDGVEEFAIGFGKSRFHLDVPEISGARCFRGTAPLRGDEH